MTHFVRRVIGWSNPRPQWIFSEPAHADKVYIVSVAIHTCISGDACILAITT